jgi:L-ascorbate metabolism protein UlaG (beta-lactamase superfamily)
VSSSRPGTSPADRVTWAGHSTVLIELAGERVLTDPLLGGRIFHITRRVAGPDPALGSRLSALLISHAHHDHLDVPSLRRLELEGPALVPRGSGKLVQGALPRAAVHELSEGDTVTLGSVEVQATHADHDGRRLPFGPDQPALGFVLQGPKRVYFAGDTDVFPGMGELGSVDLALLPVWGWGRRVPEGHLDPERAARATALIRPRRVVPIHWGTYASPRAWLSDPHRPAREFERLAAQAAPDVAVDVLSPGEGLSLE